MSGGVSQFRNAGASDKVVLGVVPLNNAAGTRAGAAGTTGVSRVGYNSVTVVCSLGVTEGTPTSFTYNVEVRHCDTVGGTYADYTPPEGPSGAVTSAITEATSASQVIEKDVDLSGAKEFILVSEVIVFVGGATPKLNSGVNLVMRGPTELPAA